MKIIFNTGILSIKQFLSCKSTMKYVIFSVTLEVEEVLENLTERLTLLWSFEMVAFQLSPGKITLSSSKNFVSSAEALQYFVYTPRRVLFRSFPSCSSLHSKDTHKKNSSARKASGHILNLRSNFSRDNKPSEFCFL